MEKSKKNQLITFLSVILCYTAVAICIASTSIFATDFFSKSQSGLRTIYGQLLSLTLPIAGVCFIFCCICAFFATSPQATQKWMNYGKRVVLIYAAIMGVGYIFTTVKNLVGDSSQNLF